MKHERMLPNTILTNEKRKNVILHSQIFHFLNVNICFRTWPRMCCPLTWRKQQFLSVNVFTVFGSTIECYSKITKRNTYLIFDILNHGLNCKIESSYHQRCVFHSQIRDAVIKMKRFHERL